MERKEILEKLKEILISMDASKKDVIVDINDDTSLVEGLGLSSVALIYMVVGIEETFNITFDELGVEDFKTVGTTIDYIARKL